jgi:hypothetical protein
MIWGESDQRCRATERLSDWLMNGWSNEWAIELIKDRVRRKPCDWLFISYPLMRHKKCCLGLLRERESEVESWGSLKGHFSYLAFIGEKRQDDYRVEVNETKRLSDWLTISRIEWVIELSDLLGRSRSARRLNKNRVENKKAFTQSWLKISPGESIFPCKAA